MEHKIRRVHKILVENSYDVLMVEARAGENFGDLTARYLGRLKNERGVMIAVCTRNYGEMTASKYSTFEELRFAMTHGISVLPLKMEGEYPPRPPCGGDHLDKDRRAHGFIDMVFNPLVVYIDAWEMSEVGIAMEIATRLRGLRN